MDELGDITIAGWTLRADWLEEQFIRASGPGGQHVNTTSTAVQLRLDAKRYLPEGWYSRLAEQAQHLLNDAGELQITARSARSQWANRRDARLRLVELLTKSARRNRPRIATRPSRASVRRQQERKRAQSQKKQLRQKPPTD